MSDTSGYFAERNLRVIADEYDREYWESVIDNWQAAQSPTGYTYVEGLGIETEWDLEGAYFRYDGWRIDY